GDHRGRIPFVGRQLPDEGEDERDVGADGGAEAQHAAIMPRTPPSRWNSPSVSQGPFRTDPGSAAGHVSRDSDPASVPPRPDVGVAPVPGTPPVAEGGPGMDQGHVTEQADQDVVPLEAGQRRGGRGPDEEGRPVEQRPVRTGAEEIRRQMLLEPPPVGTFRGPEVLVVEPEQDLAVGCRPGRHGHSSSPWSSPCMPWRGTPAGEAPDPDLPPRL